MCEDMPASPAVLVTPITGGYAHWLAHLLLNVRHLRLTARLYVCALDVAAVQVAREHAVPVVTLTSGVVNQTNDSLPLPTSTDSAPLSFHDSGYPAVVQRKPLCALLVASTLADGTVVLLADADVTLFADPIPWLPSDRWLALMQDDGPGNRNYGPFDASPNTSVGTPNYFNSGFILMRVGDEARRFWRQVLAWQARKGARAMDQEGVNRALAAYHTRSDPHGTSRPPLPYAALPIERFMNGFHFYEERPMVVAPAEVVAVHHVAAGDVDPLPPFAYSLLFPTPFTPVRREPPLARHVLPW